MKQVLSLMALIIFISVSKSFAQGTLSIQANHVTVCAGKPVTLYAIGAGTTVSWQPSGQTSKYITVYPTETTTYTLTSGTSSVTYTVNVCNNSDCISDDTFNPLLLNTGSDGLTSVLGVGSTDTNWEYSLTSNGTYNPAIVSNSSYIPANYSKTIWPNAQWVGPNAYLNTIRAGDYYFRVQFNLTAAEANSLVLDMQFMADNRVQEVSVNGVTIPNSSTPGTTDVGFQAQNAASVNMQGNWVEGLNTVLVKINDEGGYVGFVAQLNPQVVIPVSDVTCDKKTVTIDKDTVGICKGDSIQLHASQAVSYSWQPADGLSDPSSADPKASPIQTTMYYVRGTDASNNQSVDSILVVVNNPPSVSLGNGDTTKCNGEVLVFNVAQDGASVLWQNGSTNPVYMITDDGTYSVQLSNQCGKASDTLRVHPCCEYINIPNLITPNGDNLNDYFNIGCLGSGGWNLKVFNRWGDLVYSNDDYHNQWNGNRVNDGVYYYELSKEYKKDYKGWVEIIR